MKTLVLILLIIHVSAGVTALIVGLILMLLTKGNRLHKRVGLIFVYCMMIVAATALLLCVLQPFKMMRLFLTGIAVFSFYLTMTGWRATKQKTTGPTLTDKTLTFVTLAVSLSMIGFGVYLLVLNGPLFLPIVFTFFGVLTLTFAARDVRLMRQPTEKMHWFFQHFTRMGGAYIATFTAALVTNMGRVLPANAPEWVSTMGWILPTVIGGAIVARTVRYYRARFAPKNAMKTILHIVFWLTVIVGHSVTAIAQKPLTGQLVDAQKQPISYASIGVVGTPVGTIADGTGRFTLYVTEKVTATDTVRITLIGYQSLAFAVAELTATLSVSPQMVMTETVRQLSEVRVETRNSRVKTLGKTGYKTGMVTNFALSELPRQNLGSEIGRRFNVSKGENRLESFQFYVITNYDSVAFRINAYWAKDMKNLLTQNIYVRVTGKTRQWVSVDLLPYQITTSEDVIIAVQWIDSVGNGTAVQMPLQMPATATHYYRYGSQDRWKKFRGMTTAMNLTFTRNRR